MADLPSLLTTLAELDAQHDLAGMRRVREQIALEHPESDAAVEALYKIGLDVLFRDRELDLAVAQFIKAAQGHQPFWSAAARTSLGLCYYHQRQVQPAVFELRKVAYAKTPTLHSVTALAFLENIFLQEDQTSEAAQVRKERIGQLEQLIIHNRKAQGLATERGYYLYLLGLAYFDQADTQKATAALLEAKKMGSQVLGADLYRNVCDALPAS